MALRVTPAAPDRLHGSSLNKLHECDPPAKRRKIKAEDASGTLLTTSIVIRAHAASLSDESLVFTPICLLPRSRFPLSWLEDPAWLRSDAQPAGLFAADNPPLELDLRSCTEPTVLAVRLAATGALYVIERIKRGIYSLWRLARWIQEGDIVVAAKGWQGSNDIAIDLVEEDKPPAILDGSEWWQNAQIEEPSSDLILGEEFAGLQVSVVFQASGTPEASRKTPSARPLGDPKQTAAGATPVREGQIDPSTALAESLMQSVDHSTNLDLLQESKRSAEELLEGMREHYLQALYISKTSLAYFAKGPLTRCRAAFNGSDTTGAGNTCQLIEHYREAILAAKKMDLKYRESLPAAVREAVLAVSEDEASSTKNRRTKKKKLGKDGLYPEEDGFIRKWWKDRKMIDSVAQEGSREAETKKHISDLRLRETQLQILLILEILALESVPPSNNCPGDEQKADGLTDTSKKRIKKPQDLNVLLELHLDRLCIWHAVSIEDTAGEDSSQSSSLVDGQQPRKKPESDAVRDFCTEVIIPFYASRLPDKCKLITRKFGVSGGVSSAAKKTQSSSKPHRQDPSSATKRELPVKKPRKSLQRVLTDEKAAASQIRHPTLSRAKTAPTPRDATRDSLEPLLPTVMGGTTVRGGIQLKRVENREIDLNAAARQHETKLRKVQMLADQKKELDSAIQALRKPNRELVAKDIAEDVTKRLSTGGGSSRKSKNPVRNPLGEGVQVMATPRGNRRRDAVTGLPSLSRTLVPSRSFAGEMTEASLAESPVMIPSSTRRAISFSGPDSSLFGSQPRSRKRQAESQGQPQELGSIQETPTRPSSKSLFENQSVNKLSRPALPSNSGRGLFRMPELPASRPSQPDNEDTSRQAQPAEPTTPVSSRRQRTLNVISESPMVAKTPETHRSSMMIADTPPKQQAVGRTSLEPRSIPLFAPTTSQVPASPMKGIPVKNHTLVPSTPEKSQNQSIYKQLGWDDEEMDL
ncbi:Uncharacterized protein PECH_004491 [Penicillium ucsense]|uniref:DNA replication regulator Sld3 C-terminal domain-containing protein n=1 Tax=Penicillium ucsense TaxID=2839758 RepID=A0A8J8W631_9EURO|nr:Uncharacterized protein PECM_004804 [Penicillium ucsense]KAF7737002.1 Uncharacterized protein PECH_004491 [Penicillium ucsense]